MPTYNNDLLPSASGLNLGNSVQRWNLWAETIDANGLTFSPSSGVTLSPAGLLYVTSTVVTANLNTTSYQTVLSYTLPAGALNLANKTLRFTAYGVYQTQSGQTPRFYVQLSIGGQLLVYIGTPALIAASPELEWRLCGLATVNTPGSSGTVESHGSISYRAASGSQTFTELCDQNTSTVGPIDFTIAEPILIQVAFDSNTSPANICKLRYAIIELLN